MSKKDIEKLYIKVFNLQTDLNNIDYELQQNFNYENAKNAKINSLEADLQDLMDYTKHQEYIKHYINNVIYTLESLTNDLKFEILNCHYTTVNHVNMVLMDLLEDHCNDLIAKIDKI